MIIHGPVASDEEIIHDLKKFLKSRNKVAYIYNARIHFNFEKTRRVINGKPVWCLDIPIVAAEKPGNGVFSRILPEIIKINFLGGIYIKDVLTERFANFFRRHGWIQVKDFPVCFFLSRRT